MGASPIFDGPGSGGSGTGYAPPPTNGQRWSVDAVADTITFNIAPEDGLEVEVIEYTPGGFNGTTVFAVGSWCTAYGFPSEVEFFANRLWFAGTPTDPQTLWGSVTDDYTNFGRSTPTVDTDAISSTVTARRVNPIVDLIPLTSFIVLTTGGEWKLTKDQKGNVSPGVGFDPQAFCGSAPVQSIVTEDTAILVQRQGQRVFDIGYRLDSDKFTPQEISLYADHLVEGYSIVAMDWAPAPYKQINLVRSDGTWICCTYMPKQEVIGWHRHDTGRDANGDGEDNVIDVAVTPGDQESMVHILVKRVVDGVTRTYIEEKASYFYSDPVDWFYVDSGLTFDGRNYFPATTLSLTGGSTWAEGDEATLEADTPIFDANKVGDLYRLYDSSGDSVTVLVTAYVDDSTLTVELQGGAPAELQDGDAESFDYGPSTITGFDHLEGRTVAVLGDGLVQTRKVVTGGSFDLDTPAFVVQAGLPYRAHLETLELNNPGGESMRDMTKLIEGVSLLVRTTRGLKVGTTLEQDEAYLDPIQDSEFLEAGQAVNEGVTGLQRALLSSAWGENRGRIHIVSDDPVPAEVLTISPKFMASNR